jgi:hypothetical protein
VGQSFNDVVSQALSNDFNATVHKATAQQAVRDALADLARSIDLPSLQGQWAPTVTAGQASLTLGRPTVYAVFGSSATLYPTPDRSYPLTFRYAHGMGTLVDTTDLSTLIPDEYVNALVSFARHRLFRLEDDTAMSQFWRGEYERDKQAMKSVIQRGDRNRVRQVPGPYASARSAPRFMRP